MIIPIEKPMSFKINKSIELEISSTIKSKVSSFGNEFLKGKKIIGMEIYL